MPRDGSGIYSKPAGTAAVSGTTIESAKYNSTIDDLVTDANTARPIVAGGTGSTTAAGARTALGVAIGANVQAYDADLTAIAALVSAADKLPYATGAGAWALADLSAAGRALIDDANAAAQLTTLGAQPLDADLTALAALSTTGMLARTAANTYIPRSLTAGAGISVTNGDGVGGNPVISQTTLGSFYESAAQTITADGDLTLTHGLGGTPKLVMGFLICNTASAGFAVGDEIPYDRNASSNGGVTLAANSTSIKIAYGASFPVNILGGTSANLTIANFTYVVRAWL